MGLGSRRNQHTWTSVLADCGSYCRVCPSIDTKVPNVLHSTFNRDGSGADFLRSFVQRYDQAKSKQRRTMLEDLLGYISHFSPRAKASFEGLQKSRLQEGWQEIGVLILVRMVAHLTVTLPRAQIQSCKRTVEMTQLQLCVIQALLSLREKIFADAFFQCGASFLFLKILSPCDFDMSDELRSIVLDSFLLVARYGRVYKEALCDSDLLAVLEESMDDTLDWKALSKFYSLLGEVFRGNPRYQKQILSLLETWLDSSAKRLCDVALRGAIVALNTLITEAPQNSHLTDKIWIYRIFAKLVALLDSHHRLSSDIVSLLCRFVRTMPHSARHLFDFCRDQMMSEHEMEVISFRLEREAYLMTNMDTDAWIFPKTGSALKGRLEIANTIALQSAQGLSVAKELDEKNSNMLVRWSLIMFLCKNHQVFCEELVEEYGLTEVLLLHLCDLGNPSMQKIALEYLHGLRIHCQSAEWRVIHILREPEIFDALSVEEFIQNASPAAMRQIRFNLRSWRLDAGVFSAAEFLVHTDMITREIDELIEAPKEKNATFFITETDEATDPPAIEQGERHFRATSDVPLPFHASHEYKLRLPPIDELETCRDLPTLPDPIEHATLHFLSRFKPVQCEDATPSLWDISVEPEASVPALDLSVQVGATMASVMSTLASQYKEDKSWAMGETTRSGPMESWDDPSMSLDQGTMLSIEASLQLLPHAVGSVGKKATELLLPRPEDRDGPLTRKVLCLVAPPDARCCPSAPEEPSRPLFQRSGRVMKVSRLKDLDQMLPVSARSRTELPPVSARSQAGELPMSARSQVGELPMSARSQVGELPMSARSQARELPVSARSQAGELPMSARSQVGELPMSARSRAGEFPVSARSRAYEFPVSARSQAGELPVSARSRAGELPSDTDVIAPQPIVPQYGAWVKLSRQGARPVHAQERPPLVPTQLPHMRTVPPKLLSRHRLFLEKARFLGSQPEKRFVPKR